MQHSKRTEGPLGEKNLASAVNGRLLTWVNVAEAKAVLVNSANLSSNGDALTPDLGG